MIINLEEILENGLFLTVAENPKTFPLLVEMKENGELNSISPVKTSLKAIRIKDLVEMEGTIETVIGLSCSRCLTDFDFPVKTDFAFTFTKNLPEYADTYGKEGKELTAEEMGLIFFKGEKINIQDAVQEQVILSIPFKALCSETCKGLCFNCGKNLNEQACACDQDKGDIRFSALKTLKT
ncbi:MAG: DUF177 domain-containing protein [Proteobacteria bacterium]|nr:DUF177 domain-containing protein [Pseudomonadota bacterium]